jgi:hypothetical protein
MESFTATAEMRCEKRLRAIPWPLFPLKSKYVERRAAVSSL